MEIEEFNHVDASEDGDTLWSIEDDTLFQPCGLISHSSSSNNKTKSVFVTWNEYYLINYRFKKSKKTNKMEMAKVRIPLPNNTQLLSVHMLEYNTLLLMSDGRVHCFESIKALHNISWLKGVRAFAQSNEGFSVIRHDEQTQKLLLEVYIDLPSLGKGNSTLRHSYDITYDEQNIFQCDWKNDIYTLHSVTVAKEQEKFMQCIFGATIISDKELHIFSVAGHVFVLIPYSADATEADPEQDYNIELLCVYATPVSFMRLLPDRNMCLVYLSCGSVDIWYMSQLMGIKQRQMQHTGCEWLDYDVSSDNGDLYFTDGDQLVRLRFQYDAQLDDCVVQRCVKPVPGMLACTWVQDIEQLVCLSDNNIFYRIAFSRDEVSAGETGGALGDMTPAAIERIRGNAQVLKEYEEQPDQLVAAIQREHEKQQLVAVARTESWREAGLEATLQFQRQLPSYGADVLLLHTARNVELDSGGIFAILQLRFQHNHILMQSNYWQLHIYHGHDAHVHRVPTDLLLSRKCHIIVPLTKIPNVRLPEFTLEFVAFLELQLQITAIILPVQILEDGQTCRNLFSGQLHSHNLHNKQQLKELLAKISTPRKKRLAQQKIRKPHCLSFEQIANLYNATISIPNNLELYFVESKLSLIASTEENINVLTIQSDDSSAIYHFKQHLLLNVEPEDEDFEPIESLQLKVVKLQNEVERFYGTQSNEDFEENAEIHLESLLLKYKTIRNTIF